LPGGGVFKIEGKLNFSVGRVVGILLEVLVKNEENYEVVKKEGDRKILSL